MAPQVSSSAARRFVDVFWAAARQAGAVAQHLQGHVRDLGKEGSDSPESAALSVADLATQDVLLLRLAEAFPDLAVDAEEDTDIARSFPPPARDRPLVILDPIDGSLNYLDGSPDYAVMAAWIERGRYTAAVMHFPAWPATWWAVRGGGCHRRAPDGRDTPALLRDGELPRRVLVPSSTPADACACLQAGGLSLQTSRCSAVDAAAPVLGRALGSVYAGTPDRRRAIGFLLVTEAGGSVRFADGPWDASDPEAPPPRGACAVAGDDALARSLLAAVRG